MDVARVLLIGPAALDTDAWQHAGTTIEVVRERSLEHAIRRLDTTRVDAIVAPASLLDERSSADLIARSGDATLLAADFDATDAPDRTDGFVRLPAAAPGAVQAELLLLAVERSRLHRELSAARNAVRETDALFRNVIERNADAIVVVDRHGVIRFANPMAEQLFGRDRADLLGSEFGYPMVAGGTTELDLSGRGGTRLVEMRVVESQWKGELACLASLRDITERRQAEDSARRVLQADAARTAAENAAARFRFLAESSQVLSSSLDFRTTLVELARLCVTAFADWAVVYIIEEGRGVRRLEVAHRDPGMHELARELRNTPIPPDGLHPVLDVVRTGRSRIVDRVDEAQLEQITSDARHRELLRALGLASFIIVPLVARHRSLGAIALVNADPDRRFSADDIALADDLALRAALAIDNARLYTEAQQANRAKSDLFAAISHDLRTPLNSIMGHAELLSMGIPDALSDAGLERVGRIRTAASHLLHLIDELLTLVRLEAGREELRLARVTVDQLAQDVLAVMEPLARERGLDFRIAIAEPGLTLRTDPDRLRQVLFNLAANAVKYTEHGEVRLGAQRHDDTVLLQVQDTGVGIAPGDLARVFEPFWQADPARRSPRGGAGIGLSVVQRLVRLLGGTIQVESTPGAGSTFTVALPLDAAPAGPDPPGDGA